MNKLRKNLFKNKKQIIALSVALISNNNVTAIIIIIFLLNISLFLMIEED